MARNELAKLTVTLEAHTEKYQKDLDKTNKRLSRFEKNQKRSIRGIQNSWIKLGGIGVFTAIVSQTVKLTDQYTALNIRIRTATKETGDFEKVQAKLIQSAIKTGAEFSAVVSVFQAFSRVRVELGATNDQLLKISDTVNKLGVISGATNEAMRNGLRQLSQAFASDIFRAEEFNSIVENIPEIVARVAKEMGKTQGELRKLVIQGELFSKDFAQALLDASEEVNKDFDGIAKTMGRSSEALLTSTGAWLAQLDKGLGITKTLAEVMQGIADTLDPSLQRVDFFQSSLDIINAGNGNSRAKLDEIQLITDKLIEQAGKWRLDPDERGEVTKLLNNYLTTITSITEKVDQFRETWDLSGKRIKVSLVDDAIVQAKKLEELLQQVQSAGKGISNTLGNGDNTESVNKNAQKLIESFKQQITVYGLSSREAKIRIALLGKEDEAYRTVLTSLSGELDALDAEREKHEKSDKAIQDHIQSIEKQRDAFKDLQKSLQSVSESLESRFNENLQTIIDGTVGGSEEQNQAIQRLIALFEKDSIKDSFGLPFDLDAINQELLSQEEKLRQHFETNRAIIEANAASAFGTLTPEQVERLTAKHQAMLDKNLAALEDNMNEMSVFVERAAENMQDAFADFLFDPFDKGLDGMLLGFTNILKRMAAEAAAAQIFDGLKGKAGSGGILGFFGNFLSGKRALGGPVGAGQSYLVGEQGPEVFTPSSSGKITPNGGGGVVINQVNTFNTDSDSAAITQLQIESMGEKTKADIMNLVQRGRFL